MAMTAQKYNNGAARPLNNDPSRSSISNQTVSDPTLSASKNEVGEHSIKEEVNKCLPKMNSVGLFDEPVRKNVNNLFSESVSGNLTKH